MQPEHDTQYDDRHPVKQSRRRLSRSRRGMSILVVLGIIAITLAMSYSILRSQSTMMQIQGNSEKRNNARQAALTGLAVGIRKMHESDWAGVNTTLAGEINSNDSYQVTYLTGDPDLTPTHEDYDEFPYRVTVTSIGYSATPGDAVNVAVHTSQAVVQLIPKRLSDEPSSWTSLQGDTITQWEDSEFQLELPARIEGSVHAQGEIALAEQYPSQKVKPFDGYIDEVAIYDKALSGTQLWFIYLNAFSGLLPAYYNSHGPVHWWRFGESSGSTTAADSAGSADGSVEGATFSGAAGVSGAARFDGEDDYINVGAVNISGDKLTILAWLRADDFGTDDGRIISKAMGINDSDHYFMLSTIGYGGDARLRFRLKTSGVTTTLIAGSGGKVSPGEWVFAACVYDGSKMYLYKNGSLVASTTKTGNMNTSSDVMTFLGENPPGNVRSQYLRDLQKMNEAGEGDYRPFTGEIINRWNATSSTKLDFLNDDLNVSTSTTSSNTTERVSHPGAISSYQLYPGGKSYNVETIASYLEDETLEANPETNPLGLFRYDGDVEIEDDVMIRGTVITGGASSGGDIAIRGTGVQMSGVDLKSLEGSNTPIQLPVALAKDDIYIHDSTEVSIRGFVAAWDNFQVQDGNDSVHLDFQGKLLCKAFQVQNRWQWDQSDSWWESVALLFHKQKAQAAVGSRYNYLPKFLKANYQLDYEPKVVIKPEASAVQYHWQDWSQPVYIAHPDDAGLCWELLKWKENVD